MTYQHHSSTIALLFVTCFCIAISGCRLPNAPWDAPPASISQGAPIQVIDEAIPGLTPPLMPSLPSVGTTLRVGDLLVEESPSNTTAALNPGETVPLSYYLTPADQTYPDPPSAWATSENFLILGTDKRPQDPIWRTDVIMVVGLDREAGRAAILSIPRDLYVEIPGTRANRINTVDYMGDRILRVDGGGAALVSQVVRKQFGIQTTHWVRIQMDGLSEIVDAVGGVTVELECPFFEPILNLDTNEWEYFTLPAGEVTLDGDSARWFVRLRLRESDMGRSRRQRQLLGALKDKLLSSNAFLRFPDLWGTMSEVYDTDLGLIETMRLATFALSLETDNVRSSGITSSGGALVNHRTEQGAQVLRVGDETAIRRMLEEIWDEAALSDSEAAPQRACPPVPVDPPGNPYAAPPIQQTQPQTPTVGASN